MLRFVFDGAGGWDSGAWRIVVCDDGTFDVSESDQSVTNRKSTFETLSQAIEFCRECDTAHDITEEWLLSHGWVRGTKRCEYRRNCGVNMAIFIGSVVERVAGGCGYSCKFHKPK